VDFEAFGDLGNHVRMVGQLSFESGRGATSESGEHVPPCPNVEPPLLHGAAKSKLDRFDAISA